ncbi:MAG: antibiotic biosynthesis monooxygenase, partial [Planctomycetota bacterium]|nr:antibiotic biosynthesis monooxygenase [Planctomycetota bacterium]
QTPDPPYFAVIFTAKNSGRESEAYAIMADRMFELARAQPGFLGVETVHDAEGQGITVSYWESLEAIKAWKGQDEHLIAQKNGRERWYDAFQLRISRVEQAYGMGEA